MHRLTLQITATETPLPPLELLLFTRDLPTALTDETPLPNCTVLMRHAETKTPYNSLQRVRVQSVTAEAEVIEFAFEVMLEGKTQQILAHCTVAEFDASAADPDHRTTLTLDELGCEAHFTDPVQQLTFSYDLPAFLALANAYNVVRTYDHRAAVIDLPESANLDDAADYPADDAPEPLQDPHVKVAHNGEVTLLIADHFGNYCWAHTSLDALFAAL